MADTPINPEEQDQQQTQPNPVAPAVPVTEPQPAVPFSLEDQAKAIMENLPPSIDLEAQAKAVYDIPSPYEGFASEVIKVAEDPVGRGILSNLKHAIESGELKEHYGKAYDYFLTGPDLQDPMDKAMEAKKNGDALGFTKGFLGFLANLTGNYFNLAVGRSKEDSKAAALSNEADTLIGKIRDPKVASRAIELGEMYLSKLDNGQSIISKDQEPKFIVKADSRGGAGPEPSISGYNFGMNLAEAEKYLKQLEEDQNATLSSSALRVFATTGVDALPFVTAGNIYIDDETDPEQVAKRRALTHKINEVIRNKYYGPSVAGSVAGSLGGFVGAGKLATKLIGTPAVVGGRSIQIPNSFSRWGTYAIYGGGEALEDTRDLPWSDRLLDVAENIVKIGVSERIGEAGGTYVERLASTKLAHTGLTASIPGLTPVTRNAAFLTGGITSETISNQIDRVLAGQAPLPGLGEDAATASGAVFGMYLIGKGANLFTKPGIETRIFDQAKRQFSDGFGQFIDRINESTDLTYNQKRKLISDTLKNLPTQELKDLFTAKMAERAAAKNADVAPQTLKVAQEIVEKTEGPALVSILKVEADKQEKEAKAKKEGVSVTKEAAKIEAPALTQEELEVRAESFGDWIYSTLIDLPQGTELTISRTPQNEPLLSILEKRGIIYGEKDTENFIVKAAYDKTKTKLAGPKDFAPDLKAENAVESGRALLEDIQKLKPMDPNEVDRIEASFDEATSESEVNQIIKQFASIEDSHNKQNDEILATFKEPKKVATIQSQIRALNKQITQLERDVLTVPTAQKAQTEKQLEDLKLKRDGLVNERENIEGLGMRAVQLKIEDSIDALIEQKKITKEEADLIPENITLHINNPKSGSYQRYQLALADPERVKLLTDPQQTLAIFGAKNKLKKYELADLGAINEVGEVLQTPQEVIESFLEGKKRWLTGEDFKGYPNLYDVVYNGVKDELQLEVLEGKTNLNMNLVFFRRLYSAIRMYKVRKARNMGIDFASSLDSETEGPKVEAEAAGVLTEQKAGPAALVGQAEEKFDEEDKAFADKISRERREGFIKQLSDPKWGDQNNKIIFEELVFPAETGTIMTREDRAAKISDISARTKLSVPEILTKENFLRNEFVSFLKADVQVHEAQKEVRRSLTRREPPRRTTEMSEQDKEIVSVLEQFRAIQKQMERENYFLVRDIKNPDGSIRHVDESAIIEKLSDQARNSRSQDDLLKYVSYLNDIRKRTLTPENLNPWLQGIEETYDSTAGQTPEALRSDFRNQIDQAKENYLESQQSSDEAIRLEGAARFRSRIIELGNELVRSTGRYEITKSGEYRLKGGTGTSTAGGGPGLARAAIEQARAKLNAGATAERRGLRRVKDSPGNISEPLKGRRYRKDPTLSEEEVESGNFGTPIAKRVVALPEQVASIVPEATMEKLKKATKPIVWKALNEDQRKTFARIMLALNTKNGSHYLGDSAGLGKTRPILAVADYSASQNSPVVILTDSSALTPDWRKNDPGGSLGKDAKEMGIKLDFRGVAERPLPDKLAPGEILLTTFQYIDQLKEKGLVTPQTVLLIDEAHKLNGNGVWAETGASLMQTAKKVLLASGTPFETFEQMTRAFRRLGIFGEGGIAEDNLEKVLGFKTYRTRGGRGEETLRAKPDKKLLSVMLEKDIVKLERQRVEAKNLIAKLRTQKDFSVANMTAAVNSLSAVDGVLGVTEEDQQRRIRGFLGQLAKANLYSASSMSLEGVTIDQVFLPLDEEIKRKLGVLNAQGGGSANTDGKRKEALEMAHRYALELYKVPTAVDLTFKALGRGEKIIVFVEQVKQPKSTTGILDKPSAIVFEEMLRVEAAKRGIPVEIAKMYDPKISGQKKKDALRSFQGGNANVLIATKETAGTGGELDDKFGPEKGGKPRYVIFLANPFSAIQFIQAVGRTWRRLTASYPKAVLLTTNAAADRIVADLRTTKDILLGATLNTNISELGKAESLEPQPEAKPSEEIVLEGELPETKGIVRARSARQKVKPAKKTDQKAIQDFMTRLRSWVDMNLTDTARNPTKEVIAALKGRPSDILEEIIQKDGQKVFEAFGTRSYPVITDFIEKLSPQFSFGRSANDIIQEFTEYVYENKPIAKIAEKPESPAVDEDASDKHEDNYIPKDLTKEQELLVKELEDEVKKVYKSDYKNGVLTITDRKGKQSFNVQFVLGAEATATPGSSDDTDVITLGVNFFKEEKNTRGKKFQDYLKNVIMHEVVHVKTFRVIRDELKRAGKKGSFADLIKFFEDFYDSLDQNTIEKSVKLYHALAGRGAYTGKELQEQMSLFATNKLLVSAELMAQLLGINVFGKTTELALAPNRAAYNRAKARQDALFVEEAQKSPVREKFKMFFNAAETALASLRGISSKAAYVPADFDKEIKNALDQLNNRVSGYAEAVEEKAEERKEISKLSRYHLEFENNVEKMRDLEFRDDLTPEEEAKYDKLKRRQSDLQRLIIEEESKPYVNIPPEAGKTNPFPSEEPNRFNFSTLRVARMIDLAENGLVSKIFNTDVQQDLYGKFLPWAEFAGSIRNVEAYNILHPTEIYLMRWALDQYASKKNVIYLSDLKQSVLESAEDMEEMNKLLPESIFIRDDQALPEEIMERAQFESSEDREKPTDLYYVRVSNLPAESVWGKSNKHATARLVFRILGRGQTIYYEGKAYSTRSAGPALIKVLEAQDPTFKIFAKKKPYLSAPPIEEPEMVISQGGANWLARVLDVIPNEEIRNRLEANLTYKKLTNEETKQRALDYINEVSKRPDGFNKLVRQFLNDTFPRRTPLVIRTAIGFQIANLLAQRASDGDANAQELMAQVSMVLQDRHMIDPGRAIQYLWQGPDLAADALAFTKVLESQIEAAAKLRMEPYIPYLEQTTEEIAKADLEAGDAFASSPQVQDIVSQIQRFEKLKQNAAEELAQLNSEMANMVMASESRFADIFSDVISPVGLPPSNTTGGDNLGFDDVIVNKLANYMVEFVSKSYAEANDILEPEKLKKMLLLSPFFTTAKNPEARLRVFYHHFLPAYNMALPRILEAVKDDYNITQKELEEAKAKVGEMKTRGRAKIIADDFENIVTKKRKKAPIRQAPRTLKDLVAPTAKEIIKETSNIKDPAIRIKLKEIARYIKSQAIIGPLKEKGILTPRKTEGTPTAAQKLLEFYEMFEEGTEFIADVRLYISNTAKESEKAILSEFLDKILEKLTTVSTFSRVVTSLESIGGTNKTIQRLIRDPKESITEFKKELQRLFIDGTTMPENLRQQAADYLSKSLEDMVAAKRKEALTKLKERLAKTAERKTRKVRSAIDKLMDAANLGLLTDPEIFQQIHMKLGLPEFGDKERARVNEMILNLSKYPEGRLRNAKISEINDYIKTVAPITFSKIAPSYQTANLLNAIGSLGINATSAINGVAVEGLQAYGLATAKQTLGGKEQKLQALGIKKGIEALQNAWFSEKGLARKAASEVWKLGRFPTDSAVMKEFGQFNIFEAMLKEKQAAEAGKRGDQVAELKVKLPFGVSPIASFLSRLIPQFVKKSGPVQALSEVISKEGRELKINLQAEWKPELKFLPERLKQPVFDIVTKLFPTKLIDTPLALRQLPFMEKMMEAGSPYLKLITKVPIVGKYLGRFGGIADVPIYPYNSALGSYVLSSRLMAASDTFIKFGARDLGRVVETAYLLAKENPDATEEEFLDQMAIRLNRTSDSIERAMKLAMSEAKQFAENGEIVMTPEDILLRADEILDQNMPKDEFTKQVIERANVYAQRLSFQQDYEGYIGFIAGSLDAVAKHFWVSASILKFLRTSSALANEFLNYAPGVSFLRYFRGMGGLLAHTEATKRFYRPPAMPNSYQRDMLRSKMIIGHSMYGLIIGLIWSALNDDKENPWFFVHFKGPKDPAQRKAFFSAGGTLKSMQIGKFGEPLMIGGVKVAEGPVFIAWESLFPGATGFLMPVAATGEAVRYEKRSFAEAAPSILATAGLTTGLGIIDMAVLTGARNLLQLVSPSSTAQDTIRNFATLTGQLAASYVPFYPKLRDYDALYDGLMGQPRAKLYKDGFASYFLSSFPIVSRFGDQDLDFLGGQVSTDVINTVPLVKRFFKLGVSGSEYDRAAIPTDQQIHDKLISLFAKHGRRINWDAGSLNDIAQIEMAQQAAQGIPVDKSVYEILALTRDLTEDEKYEWVKLAGPLIQADLSRLIPNLEAAEDAAEFDFILDKMSNVSAIKRNVLRAILIRKFSEGIMRDELP